MADNQYRLGDVAVGRFSRTPIDFYPFDNSIFQGLKDILKPPPDFVRRMRFPAQPTGRYDPSALVPESSPRTYSPRISIMVPSGTSMPDLNTAMAHEQIHGIIPYDLARQVFRTSPEAGELAQSLYGRSAPAGVGLELPAYAGAYDPKFVHTPMNERARQAYLNELKSGLDPQDLKKFNDLLRTYSYTRSR